MITRTCKKCRKDWAAEQFTRCPYCGHKDAWGEIAVTMVVLAVGVVLLWLVLR